MRRRASERLRWRARLCERSTAMRWMSPRVTLRARKRVTARWRQRR